MYGGVILGTGVVTSAALAMAHDTPIFAHTLIQNLTPLMIMAALGWVARKVGHATKSYRELCDEVSKLATRMTSMESTMKQKQKQGKRGKRRG